MNKILLMAVFGVLIGSNIGLAQTDKAFLPAVYKLLLNDSIEQIPDITPRDADERPLASKRFVPFTRQMEYMQIGVAYKGDLSQNFFAIDPLKYNFDPNNPGEPIDPEGPDDLLYTHQVTDFADPYQKTAASGMMDDDIQDEIAVVSWGDTGPGKLIIIDPTGAPNETSYNFKSITNVDLKIEGDPGMGIEVDPDRPYDYDIAMGDVDGDGYDEIIIAGSIGGIDYDPTPMDRLGKLWVVDDDRAGNVLLGSEIIWNGNNLGVDQLKVAVGNIDDDPADEIAVAYAAVSQLPNDTDVGSISTRVYYDFANGWSYYGLNGPSVQKQYAGGDAVENYTAASPYGNLWNYYNISMGDMDGDGRAEIAIGIRYMKTNKRDFSSWTIWGYEHVVVTHYEYIDVYVFDVVSGSNVYQQRSHEYTTGGTRACGISGCSSWNLYLNDFIYSDYLKFFDTIDIDGDNKDEIFTGSDLLDDLVSGNALGFLFDGYDEDPGSEVDDNVKLKPWLRIGDFVAKKIRHVSIGDVNGDLREDITMLYDDGIIQTIGFEENVQDQEDVVLWKGGRTLETTIDIEGADLDKRGTSSAPAPNTIIVSANVDNDSVIVEYPGDNPQASPEEVKESHTVYYGRNNIIAVMAVPPAVDNINTDGSCTSFGTKEGGTTSFGADVSVRAGVLVGLETDVQLGFLVSVPTVKVQTELSTKIEYTLSAGVSFASEREITYAACDKEDRVVFSTTPYDRYIYTIASHPDPDLVGRQFTVDVPQVSGAKILTWSKSYYNEHNGKQLDIGPGILQHTPGITSSYPTSTDKTNLLESTNLPPIVGWELTSETIRLCEHDASWVGEGSSGYQDYSVELKKSDSINNKVTTSVDWLSKACAGIVCGGITGGFSIGVFTEQTWTQGLSFTSRVMNIPGQYYDRINYKYGLFSYVQTLTDNEDNITDSFIVLNYWVQ